MGRKRNDSETEQEVVQESNTEVPVKKAEKSVVYNRSAVGVLKDPKTGWMHYVEIPFNDEGDIGHLEMKSNGDNIGVIKERFLIEAAKKSHGITSEGDFNE